ncbi:pyridoxamine 5'-phosphate oxidase family protein [Xenorhabdus khoisanae]|uniref:Pyridoxamine 5'-phosphate oxidase n=1 Tax=Xenorhabdus khoisanae TaxID=880157 RepID=A0A0J5FTW2_9GAMM|nr:pyridoxamine 5'-phosphate oxidase family protein [Xenorhabdus khoisanae]KMJ45711.1 pyridoxamine 5'-phosphate oxidase [Xenorhabdus khoisanae]MDC9614841.1 pyridoxamine 5'-phosphate oxidase family protein [Xenorhabdus khoisanae]
MNKTVTDIATLEQIYGKPAAASVFKEVNYIHPVYRPFIEASPFVTLATVGPEGMDVSPRGDQAGFIHIEDEKTLLLPDRRGNNRIDSLRNILHDNHVALLFLIPGIGETLRVNGRAEIVIDPEILERFSHRNMLPYSVLRITVDAVFFQCARAILRSGLWDVSNQLERSALPSVGNILKEISKGDFDGADYDEKLPQRLKDTLY